MMAKSLSALPRYCPLDDLLAGVLAMVTVAEGKDKPLPGESLLVRASQGGDGNAYARIIDAYQARITSQMRRFTRDPATIEELVHDVFVEAYFSLKSFKAEGILLHWLRKIAVRVGYRYWKNQPSVRTEKLSDVGIEFTEEPDAAAEMLEGMMEALKPRDRLVLTLLYWDGCTVKEAAELAGWSETMVKVQAHRARKRLQRLIEESR